MGMGIPPLRVKIMLESHPLKSRISVWRLAAFRVPPFTPPPPGKDVRDRRGGVCQARVLCCITVTSLSNSNLDLSNSNVGLVPAASEAHPPDVKIHQRGVQWEQGVVNYVTLYITLSYNTTPIHCNPPPTAPRFAEYPG